MRLALFGLAALRLAAADGLAGKWAIEADIVGNAVNMNCSFEQNAEAKIAGKCTLASSQSSETVTVAGEAKGEKFTFSLTTASGYTLHYTGALQGDVIKGEIEVSGASGTFTGKRAAS
jgi:hypothetical protein